MRKGRRVKKFAMRGNVVDLAGRDASHRSAAYPSCRESGREQETRLLGNFFPLSLPDLFAGSLLTFVMSLGSRRPTSAGRVAHDHARGLAEFEPIAQRTQRASNGGAAIATCFRGQHCGSPHWTSLVCAGK
jgi:hypothetical protein